MKKIAQAGTSVLLMLATLFLMTPTVQAAVPPVKEEVVYALLAGDGSVEGVYVVNKFNLRQAGSVTDYGRYAAVRNMTDNGELARGAGQVEFYAQEGQFYYEGEMEEAELPWRFTFRYTLNGQTLSAQELAGQSGALRIDIGIAQNPKANAAFFEEYALQLTVVLDTGRCQNITAHGATAANVGSDRQLTYTVLPGSEKELTITADVQDFEMEPISIDGVRLALDFDIDDEELLGQVVELMDGIAELDDGAQALADGADEMAQGAEDLQAGVVAMQSGLDTLNGKSAELTGGSAQMLDGLSRLGAGLDAMQLTSEDVSALVTASGQIKTGIDGLSTGAGELQSALSYEAYRAAMLQNGLDVDALMASNAGAAAGLNTQIVELTALRDGLAAADPADPTVAQLTATIDALTQMTGLLSANNSALAGLEGYFGGLGSAAAPLATEAATLSANYATFDATIQQLAASLGALPREMQTLRDAVQQLIDAYALLDGGINEYTAGVASLVAGYTQLKDGVNTLAEGCAGLQAGCGDLADGTGRLREETDGMDEQITEKVDGMLSDITGEEGGEVVSFTSAQNKNIKSVQFALRTSAIEAEEPAPAEMDEPEPKGFWQRLLDLFR